MARRSNDDDKKQMRRPGSGQGKGQEQEEEKDKEPELEKDGPEAESARAQNQFGNQGVISLMETAAAQTGVDVEIAKRSTAHEKEGVDYGGEDDPFDPAAIDQALFEGWNAGTTQPTERPDFVEPMPDDELPPEDPEFIQQAIAFETPELPGTPNVDAWLQPSIDTLARSMRGWNRAVERWTGDALHRRAWGALARQGAPLMWDPAGRVLFGRSRTAALSTLLWIDGQVVDDQDYLGASLFQLLLELEGRHWQVRSVRNAITDPKSRPNATELFTWVIGTAEGAVQPRKVGPHAAAAIDTALQSLLTLENAQHLIPRIAVPDPVAEEDDDPLGIDAVLAGFTGGAPDPAEPLYRSALQAAERLASAMQLTKVRMAGVAVALSDVVRLRGANPPNATLLDGLKYLDEQCVTLLNRLREIARACQKRSATIQELCAALETTALDLEWIRGESRRVLAVIIAGVLGEVPEPRLAPPPPDDPLAEAWADGQPRRALDWLRTLPPRLERDAAIAFTEMTEATDPVPMVPLLESVLEQATAIGAWPVQGAIVTLLVPCLLRTGDLQRALQLSREHGQRGLIRRNGVWVADAALNAMEAYRLAGRPDFAERVRLQAGAACYRLHAGGALSLLARWSAESPELTDEVTVG